MGMIIMNGKEYTSSPKDGFPPIIYSDEEREIGVWRDGKPLYQKSYSVNLPSSFDVSGGFLIDNDISYIDVLVDGFGSGVSPEGYIVSMGGLASVSGWRFNLHRNSSNQLVFFVSDADNHLKNGKAHVTIQYTKTTDVPGSGKYTTYGELTHHYSENEQVVGTGINGKPVYEITKVVTGSYSKGSENVFTVNVSNVTNLRMTEGYIVYNSSIYIPVTICINTNAVVYVYFSTNANSIEIHINSTEWDYTRFEITLRYQKTTD